MESRLEWKENWEEIRDYRATLSKRGVALIELLPTSKGGKLHVTAPYNKMFNERAKELGGRWLRRSRVWSFNASSLRLVVNLCHQVYSSSKTIRKGWKHGEHDK